MFVVPCTTPKYLFGKNFLASFEVDGYYPSFENTVFSGIVETGTFNTGDKVYIMNSNYKVLAYGEVNFLMIDDSPESSVSSQQYVTNFEITTEFPETYDALFIVKPEESHMRDLFIIKSNDEDVFFIDYAFDFKTAICKYLNANFEIKEDAFEKTWSNLSQSKVKNIISNLNAEGRDETETEDGKVELIYIPQVKFS